MFFFFVFFMKYFAQSHRKSIWLGRQECHLYPLAGCEWASEQIPPTPLLLCVPACLQLLQFGLPCLLRSVLGVGVGGRGGGGGGQNVAGKASGWGNVCVSQTGNHFQKKLAHYGLKLTYEAFPSSGCWSHFSNRDPRETCATVFCLFFSAALLLLRASETHWLGEDCALALVCIHLRGKRNIAVVKAHGFFVVFFFAPNVTAGVKYLHIVIFLTRILWLCRSFLTGRMRPLL